ncbi:MAG: TIGR04282 family arsenosugar biosynthesis glycosyltransferase [Cyanobacteriota bacterium]|nr:TIGR04282 family arsenosugar biosynthesis glycosyltransferase [Cyanobacteriota bacterium]
MRAARRQLVILTRWPAPARCKRRLAVAIGPERAALVQGRLLHHGLGTAREAARVARRRGEPIEVVLAVSGLGPRARGRWAAALPVDRCVGQGEGSLGVRLRRQVERARREAVGAVLLIGSDLPRVSPADLLAAFAALRRRPLVVGPAADGGYWLLGLSPPLRAPRLFAGVEGPIPWGGDAVLRCTLAAAAAEGLTPALLAEGQDLDTPADLAAWR